MYNQVRDIVRHCATCRYHSYRAPATPTIGHTTATEPAQALAMDIIHLKDQKGYKYGLTAVNVYTRFGFLIPLKSIEAADIV